MTLCVKSDLRNTCMCQAKLVLTCHKNTRLGKVIRKISCKFHYLGWMCLLLLVMGVNAQEKPIYKTIDKNGRIIFTDNPPAHEEAESIDLQETNIQPGGQTYSSSRSRVDGSSQNQPMSISIVSPAAEAKLGPADKSVTFRAQVSSSLKKREGVVFYLDGKALNSPSNSMSYTLPLSVKIRGKHVVTAVVINTTTGKTVAASSPVGFYVIRATSS